MTWNIPATPRNAPPSLRQRVTGFTLVELMLVVVVIAILAAVALPGYFDSVRKGRRADAISRVQQVQQAQERFRANNPVYSTSLSDLQVAVPADSYYDIAITTATAAGFAIVATARSGSAQASDTTCAKLTLTQAGGLTTYTSTSSGGAEDSSVSNRCWNR